MKKCKIDFLQICNFSKKWKNHGGSRRLVEARGGPTFQWFRKKSRKIVKFQKHRKNGKMENWFSGNFQLFQKIEKGKWTKHTKHQRGGAREARAPHFFIFCNFSGASLFHFFFGKVANFQKISFPFFHFFNFSEICYFSWFFTKSPSHWEDARLKISWLLSLLTS